MIKICEVCGKQFETRYNAKKYYSADCRRIRKNQQKCQFCGKIFHQHFLGEKFCSDQCRDDFFNIHDFAMLAKLVKF